MADPTTPAKRPGPGRPKSDDPRVKLAIYIKEDIKALLLACVKKGNRDLDTPGKVVEQKFKEKK